MKDSELNALKGLLAEEYGISGIDDPEELREILMTKVKRMGHLDVFAIKMKLGQKLIEQEKGRASSSHVHSFLGYLIFAVIGWFIWRPLSAIFVIFCASGQVRRISIQHSLFWGSKAPILLGTVYGTFLVIVVKIGIITSAQNLAVSVFLYLLGFLAATYVSYGVRTGHFQTRSDQLRIMTMAYSITTYMIVCVTLFFILS